MKLSIMIIKLLIMIIKLLIMITKLLLYTPKYLNSFLPKWSEKKVLNYFPRQSLKRSTFLFKLSDSIFFMLGLSPIVN